MTVRHCFDTIDSRLDYIILTDGWSEILMFKRPRAKSTLTIVNIDGRRTTGLNAVIFGTRILVDSALGGEGWPIDYPLG